MEIEVVYIKSIIMKKFAPLYLIICIALLFSCEKENHDLLPNSAIDTELFGEWSDTIEALPTGLIITNLKINGDSTFLLKGEFFGTYAGQEIDVLSGWSETKGIYEQKNDSLFFLANERISWDGTYQKEPITRQLSDHLFHNCVYTIKDNVLELTYTTYPADSPVETKKTFIRK
jgi:hypothetical protein